MKKITYYEAKDGKTFQTERECIAYEKKLEIVDRWEEANAIDIVNLCNVNSINRKTLHLLMHMGMLAEEIIETEG